jgi:type IV pilus assembly protein PilN
VGGALTFGTKIYYKGLIANQEDRNDMLRTEIALLDEQIEEIEGFEAQKNRLLERMAIIEELQVLRPESVHLMDEVVNVLPNGVYLTELTQQSRNVEMTGVSQSNQRIANLIRSITDSEWLREPGFPRIENAGSGPAAEARFRLPMQQVPTIDEEGR